MKMPERFRFSRNNYWTSFVFPYTTTNAFYIIYPFFMSAYLSKLLGFVIFSLFILLQYYSIGFHNESGKGYGAYIATLVIIYAIYKVLTLSSKKDKVTFSPLSIALYTLLHLFVLCFVYFGLV